ncbi:MAG TPA: EamA family transporter [Candidatus Angelobacter sp.]
MSAPPSATSSFPRSQLLGYIALCLIWGSTWLAIVYVVEDVPPLEACAIRFLIGGAILLVAAALQRRRWPRGERQWQAILVLSVSIMAVPYGLLFWAEQHVTSSMTAVLYSALPLVVALLTPAMMDRTVPRSAVFALLIAFGGLLVLFITGLSTNRSALEAGLAVVAAMVVSAWSVVYAKKRLHEVDSVVATGLQLLFGAVALFWGTWALEARRHAHWTRTSLTALAFLTIFGSCVAFVIYYWLLKRMQPYQLSTINLVVPLIAVLEGALIKRDAVPLMMLITMAVVLASVGSVLRGEVGSGQQSEILTLRGKIS